MSGAHLFADVFATLTKFQVSNGIPSGERGRERKGCLGVAYDGLEVGGGKIAVLLWLGW